MTIRYEANPPKIQQDVDGATKKFVSRVKLMAAHCDAIHLTENVLGFDRVSPIKIGKMLRNEISDLTMTASLRVRDKSKPEIIQYIKDCKGAGFSGVLVIMGDPTQNKMDSGITPSQIVKEIGHADVDLYLSIPNKPNFAKIGKKLVAKPKGFMTQVVQSVEQVKNLKDNLKEYKIIPIILYPSQKNSPSAKFLKLDLDLYSNRFVEFVQQIHQITGDVLITSPNDFNGLYEFLQTHNTKYCAFG